METCSKKPAVIPPPIVITQQMLCRNILNKRQASSLSQTEQLRSAVSSSPTNTAMVTHKFCFGNFRSSIQISHQITGSAPKPHSKGKATSPCFSTHCSLLYHNYPNYCMWGTQSLPKKEDPAKITFPIPTNRTVLPSEEQALQDSSYHFH